jgi:hypothetical protein
LEIASNQTNAIGIQVKTTKRTPEEELDEIEDAMDGLANEPATGIAQRNETAATIAAEGDAASMATGSNWGKDLDPEVRTAFADARVAEAAQRLTASSLASEDLVTANRKHWTKAANMAVLPTKWHVAKLEKDKQDDVTRGPCRECDFTSGKRWCWGVMGEPTCAPISIAMTCDKKNGKNVAPAFDATMCSSDGAPPQLPM